MLKFLKEQWPLFLLILVAVVITVMQILGRTPAQMTGVFLALVVSFIIYQVSENVKIKEKIVGVSQDIHEQPFIKVLKSTSEFFSYSSGVIQNAKNSVDVCYFTKDPPTVLFNDPAIKKYWTDFSDLVKKNKAISYRRIITLEDKEKAAWIKSEIDDFDSCHNMSIGIIDHKQEFPLLSAMVIDEEHVFIFSPHATSNRTYTYVCNAQFAKGLQLYFDKLWAVSDLVKEGSTPIDENLVFEMLENRVYPNKGT